MYKFCLIAVALCLSTTLVCAQSIWTQTDPKNPRIIVCADWHELLAIVKASEKSYTMAEVTFDELRRMGRCNQGPLKAEVGGNPDVIHDLGIFHTPVSVARAWANYVTLSVHGGLKVRGGWVLGFELIKKELNS
jgi:hypothetical protein